MAFLLKQETARKVLKRLGDLEGRNVARQGFVPRDLDGWGSAEAWSFSCSLNGSVSTATVTAGTVRTSTANYAFAGGDITLTGATEWVYVYHERDHSATGISHSATDPISSGSRWVWPLAKYTATLGVYKLSQQLHKGDVFLYEAMS